MSLPNHTAASETRIPQSTEQARSAQPRLRWFLLLLLAAAGTVCAQTAPQATVDLDAATAALREGNAAYERADFAAAEEAYGRAEAAGAADARLYYNHANTLFRLNRLGASILYYEKARKLDPTDADILHNLAHAQTRVADKIPEPPANFLTRMLWEAHASYPLRGGEWAAFFLFAAGFLSLTAGLFLSAAGRIASVTAAVFAFSALLLFSPSLLYKLRQHDTAVRAVVLQPVAELYSGPGATYELLFRAHEGVVFTIVSREGEWLSVKLPDGRGGFVRATDIGEV